MGQLVNGIWQDVWYDTKSTGGHFKRTETQFRHWVTPNGDAGPTGDAGFKAEAGRYHLYVSLACPWAHRTLIMRHLKGLEALISVSVVHPLMLEHGWTFGQDFEAATGDSLYHNDYLYQIYLRAMPDYTGRVTVPILWDKQNNTIVNNESSDIMRIFNHAFDEVGAKPGDYYPKDRQPEIDALNAWIYPQLNNGVYRAGFASTQEAYDEGVTEVFNALDRIEALLDKQRYLTGSQLTEADLRLWTTLIRFDPVYVTHFKCDRRRISDYPNIFAFMLDIYQTQSIADTVDFSHIRHHYYRSHGTINPYGIISTGPVEDLDAAHGRDVRFG